MGADKKIEEIIRAISSNDETAAGIYHALSAGVRQKVLKALSADGLKALTNLIKSAKKKRFAEANKRFLKIAQGDIATPVCLIDETLIEENMRVLQYVKDRTGCKIFHALKAYASFATFPMMSGYLDGTCASGLNEARLGYEEMNLPVASYRVSEERTSVTKKLFDLPSSKLQGIGKFKKEVHTFGAAYCEQEIGQILKYSDSIIFNSFNQLEKYGKMARKNGVHIGLRVNPGHAEVATDMYNPCAPCSRLGIVHNIFSEEFPKYREIVDGLHFHAMCEQNSDVLERILKSFEKLFGPYIKGLKWVNFGGGHHITSNDYDLERLVKLITNFKKKYGVQVYLEPGEASVLNAGVLISSVLDIIDNEMEIAIMDTSAETHMPDVLLMPYRPNIMKSSQPNEKKYTYRLAGPSCLAGDVIGDYSFDEPLKRGDRLVFTDMALYSIVKNTTFNGINLPDIAVIRDEGRIEIVKRFGYKDYRNRQS